MAMTPTEMKIMQLEMLVKQKDTEINRLNKIIDEGVVPPIADQPPADTPEPSKTEKKKRKAPTKPCTLCKQEVYAMWHKRHEAVCQADQPSSLGVVK